MNLGTPPQRVSLLSWLLCMHKRNTLVIGTYTYYLYKATFYLELQRAGKLLHFLAALGCDLNPQLSDLVLSEQPKYLAIPTTP